ncbi:MAG: VWA domain-containing protein [Chloroflexi bacterium]|nr:VWA domain-containing protein [Chloroflexota bacterium]
MSFYDSLGRPGDPFNVLFDSHGVRDSVGVYDTAEFADNPEARCSIVLIVDNSGSMSGDKIATVNRALVKFGDIIRGDAVTALRADVAIVAASNNPWVVQDFTNGADFKPPILGIEPAEYYSKGINLALDMIEARKQSYRDGGIAYYRSLAYFLGDGYPTIDSRQELDQVSARVFQMEENRGVAFFIFGVGIGGSCDMNMLARLGPRPPQLLTNLEQLDGSIQWLARSVAAISRSQPGEGIRLPEQDFLNQ